MYTFYLTPPIICESFCSVLFSWRLAQAWIISFALKVALKQPCILCLLARRQILYLTMYLFSFFIGALKEQQLLPLFLIASQALGCHGMGIFFKLLPLIGMQLISSSYFQAVGKPIQATLLGLSRHVFIFIPLLIILPHFWGLDGVWWSGPFSDLGAFILTSVWLWFEIRHLSKSDA